MKKGRKTGKGFLTVVGGGRRKKPRDQERDEKEKNLEGKSIGWSSGGGRKKKSGMEKTIHGEELNRMCHTVSQPYVPLVCPLKSGQGTGRSSENQKTKHMAWGCRLE